MKSTHNKAISLGRSASLCTAEFPVRSLNLMSDLSISAEITLQETQEYVRLLHAFLACSNLFSHDSDTLGFHRSDNKTLCINTCVNTITFGKTGAENGERYWSNNVDVAFIQKALVYFIYGTKSPEIYDKLLFKMPWESIPEDIQQSNVIQEE